MVITFEIEETIGTTERAAQDITRCPYGRQIGEQTTNWKTGDGTATREEKHPYRVSGLVERECTSQTMPLLGVKSETYFGALPRTA